MLQSVPHHARSTNDALGERSFIFLALCGVEWPGRRERSFDASVQQATPSLATLNQWAFHTVCVLLGISVHQWVGRYRPPTIVKATLGLCGWVVWAPHRCGGILFSNMSNGLVGAAPEYMDSELQQQGVQQSSFQASSNPLPPPLVCFSSSWNLLPLFILCVFWIYLAQSMISDIFLVKIVLYFNCVKF